MGNGGMGITRYIVSDQLTALKTVRRFVVRTSVRAAGERTEVRTTNRLLVTRLSATRQSNTTDRGSQAKRVGTSYNFSLKLKLMTND
ncbi:hypothetical protein C7B67_27705 [filamentous cyanobacterium Phorm 6]|nr:hypothetical protein C7B67_27705 [filamentous cyanobacterium Phorm 6]